MLSRRGPVKLARKTTQEAVAGALREAISQGDLPHGTRLTQDYLAAQFGVSRIPIREALWQLESEGLIEITPHRGAVVSALTLQELQEIYEIRIALEALAVSLAVPRAGEADLKKLDALISEMDDQTDPALWLDRNRDFHNALHAPAGRPRLSDLVDILRRNSERYLRVLVRLMGRTSVAQEEHRRIVEAYRRRDVDAAVAALRTHLSNTLAGVSELLRDPVARPDSPITTAGHREEGTHV
ncbi:MAG TPA: GntR family transcriptional regulator [bacterium]|nr:GntR family transcriptional regulator [bacterium]